MLADARRMVELLEQRGVAMDENEDALEYVVSDKGGLWRPKMAAYRSEKHITGENGGVSASFVAL